MSEHDELMQNMFTAARGDLGMLLLEAREELDLSGSQLSQIGHLLGSAWVAGAKAGQAEMMAQAIEQGIDVQHRYASRDETEGI